VSGGWLDISGQRGRLAASSWPELRPSKPGPTVRRLSRTSPLTPDVGPRERHGARQSAGLKRHLARRRPPEMLLAYSRDASQGVTRQELLSGDLTY